MGNKSKTGSKAIAASAKAKKAHAPAVKKVSRSMRKLLAKNDRKRKNRDARLARLAPATNAAITENGDTSNAQREVPQPVGG